MPQPLPPSLYAVGSSNSDAYTTCVGMEAYALSLPPPDHGPSTLVCARLLGYMILHAPTDDGRANISTEITSCENDFVGLCGVACKYIDHFVCCFRSTNGPTPSPSNHPSRPSFDNVQDAFRSLMEDAPSDYTTAKEKALMRDGYRCVITGRYDLTSVENGVPAAVRGMASVPAGSLPSTTKLAHVFPPSTNQNIGTAEQGGDKCDYASGVWAAMERFGQVNGFLELNGPDMHRLENVMTMEPNVHEFFDRLALWLEATLPSRSSILTPCIPDNRISQLASPPPLLSHLQFPGFHYRTHDILLYMQRVRKWLISLVQGGILKGCSGSWGI